VPCANLNGSGTLVPVDLFLDLGGLEDDLFIDHVDTEWAFRVQARGYHLFGIPQAIFRHRMGDTSRRIWLFGWRVWPVRSPRRHYFLYRNAVILMRRGYVPRVWKVWAFIKLCLTFIVQIAIGRERLAHTKSICLGTKEGIHDIQNHQI
jgi:rhamnosyltransferase